MRRRPRAGRLHRRGLAVAILLCLAPVGAQAALPGDLDQSCSIDLVDVVLLGRAVSGNLTLTPDQELAADVAPQVGGVSAPDGVIDVADWVVLARALVGLATLSDGVSEPILDPLADPPGSNPIGVTGFTCPGADVTLYVNGLPRAVTSADAGDGTFSFDTIGIDDGSNTIHAEASLGGFTSGSSNQLVASYTNPIDPANPPAVITAGTTSVWTPGPGGGFYDVPSVLTVEAGATLILVPGAELRMADEARIVVNGTLLVQGVQGLQEVLLRNDADFIPCSGSTSTDWQGIELQSGSTGSVIDGARFECVEIGVDVPGGTSVLVRNSSFFSTSTAGVRVRNGGSAVIEGNYFDNEQRRVETGGKFGDGIRVTEPGSSATIRSNEIFRPIDCIEVGNSSPDIDDNILRGCDNGLLATGSASPHLTANLIRSNARGLRLSNTASPLVDGGNIIRNNHVGIYLVGQNVGAAQPIVNGNEVRNNQGFLCNNVGATTCNYLIERDYINNDTVVLDATGNWWGSTDPEVIADSIRDKFEESRAPIVDFLPYLDDTLANGGQPAGADVLSGVVDTTVTLDPGLVYASVGLLRILSGGELIVPAGTRIEVGDDAVWEVDGRFELNGTDDLNRVVLTPRLGMGETAQRGHWQGIEINAGSSGNVVDWATIEYATRPVLADGAGASVSVNESHILQFNGSGIPIQNGASATVTNSLLDNIPGGWGGTGIDLLSAAGATITGNEFKACSPAGIRMTNTSPDIASPTVTISGNIVRAGNLGIQVNGSSAPHIVGGNEIYSNFVGISLTRQPGTPAVDLPDALINDNEIRNNSTLNLRFSPGSPTINPWPDPANTTIDVRQNYWGTTVLGEIENEIEDFSDNSNVPVALFVPFRDANGDLQGGLDILVGTIDANTTLDQFDTYSVVGAVTVATGVTLTIPEGKTLAFADGAELSVDGTLVVQGTAIDKVVFTGLETQQAGAWQGIDLTGPGNVVDHAIIEYATTGIDLSGPGADLTLTNSHVGPSSARGIEVSNGASVTLVGNVCAVSNSGDCIRLQDVSAAVVDANEARAASGAGIGIYDSSPSGQAPTVFVTGNSSHNNNLGIRIQGDAAPEITGGNDVYSNSRGIYIQNSPVTPPPDPLISGNAIYSNTENFYVTGGSPTSIVFPNARTGLLSAGGNWWGSTDPVTIAAGIIDYTEDRDVPTVDFRPFLDAQGGAPVPDETYILGPQTTPLDSLVSGDPYQAVGTLIVPDAETWLVQSGVEILMGPGLRVDVYGTLDLDGALGDRVVFDSAVPVTADWTGIIVDGAGASAQVDHTLVSRAFTSFDIRDGADLVLRDSELNIFGYGVQLSGSATALIENNLITGSIGPWAGIDVDDASPTITGNTISFVYRGIDVSGSSNPIIGRLSPPLPGNLITDFTNAGIYMVGPAGGTIADNTVDSDPVSGTKDGVGIELIDASPLVQGNTVINTVTGIHLKGTASPTVDQGNVVRDNIWGFWLEGGGAAGPDPDPVIEQNQIFDNSGTAPAGTHCSAAGANFCTSSYSLSTPVTVDARENWWGSVDSDAIRSTIITEDVNPVVVDYSDFLDGPGGVPVGGAAFSYLLGSIVRDVDHIEPVFGDTVTMSFTLLASAQVELRVFPENADTVLPIDPDPWNPSKALRTIGMSLAAGPQQLSWDGTKDDATFVTDEAYVLILVATAGSITDTYNPPRGVLPQSPSGDGDVPTSYDFYTNDNWKMFFDMDGAPARVTWQVTPQGAPAIVLAEDKPLPRRINELFVFNGRDPAGDIIPNLDQPAYFYFGVPQAVKPNFVVVERTAPRVVGPDFVTVDMDPPPPMQPKPPKPPIPQIEVRSDPYRIRHSYDQVSSFAYCLDQEAWVTIKILKPGESDPDGPGVVATLVDMLRQPRDCEAGDPPYVVTWTGYDPTAPDPFVVQADSEGAYTFTIQATHPTQPELTSIYRGIIQVQQ